MKEYDLFVPLYYNDGRQVEPQKFQDLQRQLLDHFGGLTFFPQPNEGFWTMARDARRFLSRLKKQLKEQFEQEEILMVERDVQTL